MSNKGNIAILIMAAGSSSRMKGIKQLLPWKDSNLLLNSIKTAKKVQKEHIYVVLGANAPVILKATNLTNLSVSVITNSNWEKGLGNSISCGVQHLLQKEIDFDGILICLADQPLLGNAYYKQMIYEFIKGKHPIAATKYLSGPGVPAIFSKTMAKELKQLNSDYGAKELLKKYQKSIFIFDAGNAITDIDTPEEYATLYEQYN